MPAATALDHVTVVSDDFAASRSVYEAVLGAIALTPLTEFTDPEGDDDDTGTVAAVGFAGADGRAVLWLVAGPAATTGAHLALRTGDRAGVEAAYRAGLAAGARGVQAPRVWEAAHLDYYGAQLADPSGNIIEVLYRQ